MLYYVFCYVLLYNVLYYVLCIVLCIIVLCIVLCIIVLCIIVLCIVLCCVVAAAAAVIQQNTLSRKKGKASAPELTVYQHNQQQQPDASKNPNAAANGILKNG